MIRENFDNNLNELYKDVSLMMDLVADILEKSIEALVKQDIKQASLICKLDDKIDDLMNSIEEKCIELIALQQPAAKDLRMLFSIIKIVTDLERMGDYCVNISREVMLIGKEPLIKELRDIPKMKEIILVMIKNTQESFMNEDHRLAFNIAKQDELIDELYKEIYNEVLAKIIENPNHINQGTKLLFIGRYLERIGDHLTNVCEKIIYISKGERIELN